MDTLKVRVQEYPGSKVRSYHTVDRPNDLHLCEQDGFIFKRTKKEDECFGVITFEEALADRDGDVTRKIGDVGRDIIRAIWAHPSCENVKSGTLVSHCQLTIEMVAGSSPAETDRCVVEALTDVLGCEVVLTS